MIAGRKPFPNISSSFFKVADHTVQAFDRIRGVDDLADRRIEGEEWDHLLPSPAPGRCDGGIFADPFFFKGVQLRSRR